VSKELSGNKGNRGYRLKQSQTKAAKRKEAKKSRDLVIVGLLKENIDERIRLKHSPEQISGRLKKQSITVSTETIYKYIAEDKASGGSLLYLSAYKQP